MNKCYIITAIVVVFLVVVAIAITLGIVLTKHVNNSPSLDDIISQDATFPNGSYLIDVKSLQGGSASMAPSQPNASVLEQAGVQVDDSYTVAETERLSYLYIALPPAGRRSGRSADNDTISAIATVPESGLRQVGKLSDMSPLYELQIIMPSAMCLSTGTSCTLIDWLSYTIFGDGEWGTSSELASALHISCGSQCDQPSISPCSSKLCKSCDGQQMAGGDQPKSVRFYMGTSRSNVSFAYETYTIKDDITVWYGDSIIFDTGCVGAHGIQTLKFSGSTKELRVDVHPNCAFTVGTQWWFTLGCPSGCELSNKEVALVRDNVNVVNDGDKVKITAEPKLPQLTAYYCKTGDASSVDVQWFLKLSPSERKHKCKDPKTGKATTCYTCSSKTINGTGSKWDINIDPLQGGNAVLSWIVDKKTKGSMKFSIIGTNPDKQTIMDEIDSKTELWYAKYLPAQESSYRQFASDGTPLPNWNDDGGYGVMQVTNPEPTCTMLWDWTENVKEGVHIVEGKQQQADKWMQAERTEADRQGNSTHVPKRTEGKCVFEEKTNMRIEHAVAIKANNGHSTNNKTCHTAFTNKNCPDAKKCNCKKPSASCKQVCQCVLEQYFRCGQYCAWDNINHYWIFNNVNNRGENYVKEICSMLP